MAVPGGTNGVVTDAPAQLELVGITKRFGEVVALDRAHFRLRAATVHALLGENGAGKTSLMRIAHGVLQPDSGSLRLDGVEQRLRSPADAIHRRIAMVHQHFSLLSGLSAVENFALGGRGRFDRIHEMARLLRYASQLSLSIAPDIKPSAMSVAEQQQLEIAKALGRECRILILDEPTAVLSPTHAEALLLSLRGLASAGASVVLITHKIHDAVAIADDVTVLRQGRTVLTAAMDSIDEAALLSAMLGDAASQPVEPEHRVADSVAPAATLASLRSLTTEDSRTREHLSNVNLEIRMGETVGIAGLEGSGHRLLLRILAGRRGATSGSLTLPPRIGFIPEDREREAVVADLELRDNIALRDAGGRRGWIRWREWTSLTRQLMSEYDIRSPGARAVVRNLSGGNQQKLVLARELSAKPSLIVAENPTRGLDVRATREIRERLRDARRHGAGVVLYSSDLDELTTESDRVFVAYAGHVRQCQLSRESIGRAMVGSQ